MNLILDDGYQFGLGAFETIPVYQGRPVWLEVHERRLRHTLEYLGIDLFLIGKIIYGSMCVAWIRRIGY